MHSHWRFKLSVRQLSLEVLAVADLILRFKVIQEAKYIRSSVKEVVLQNISDINKCFMDVQ